MSGKYTAGPWEVLKEEVDKDYIRIRGTQVGGRYKVADVPTSPPTGYRDIDKINVSETRANARLIAAAPELLFLLESFLLSFDILMGNNSPFPPNAKNVFRATFLLDPDNARAVIAKVKGDKGE